MSFNNTPKRGTAPATPSLFNFYKIAKTANMDGNASPRASGTGISEGTEGLGGSTFTTTKSGTTTTEDTEMPTANENTLQDYLALPAAGIDAVAESIKKMVSMPALKSPKKKTPKKNCVAKDLPSQPPQTPGTPLQESNKTIVFEAHSSVDNTSLTKSVMEFSIKMEKGAKVRERLNSN